MPADSTQYPAALAEVLRDFGWIADRQERTELLIHYANQFQPVPERVATPPYAEEHRVPACESEAYVWAEDLLGGRLKLHFAVENPQGVSAMALAAILDQTLSGLPAAEVAAVSPQIVFDLFGSELSMGKGQGLMSMVAMVQALARQRINGS